MKRALAAIVVIVAVLAGLHFAFKTKEGPLVLAYKFEKGQIDTYKAVVKTKVEAPFFSGPSSKSVQTSTMRVTQKVLKVNKDGSARIEMSQSIRGGSSMMMPMPHGSVTLTIAKNGKLAESKDIQEMAGHGFPGMDYMPMGQTSLGAVLPAHGVGVGQTWTEENPFPMGGGNVNVTATLVDDNYKLGKRRVCKIDTSYDGKFDLAEIYKKSEMRRMMPEMTGELEIKGTGTIYFSRKEGKLIKVDDKMRMTSKMQVGKAPGAGGSSTGASMSFEIAADVNSKTELVTPNVAAAKKKGGK